MTLDMARALAGLNRGVPEGRSALLSTKGPTRARPAPQLSPSPKGIAPPALEAGGAFQSYTLQRWVPQDLS